MLTCDTNCVRKLFLDSGIILSKYGSKPSNCVDKCTLKSAKCAASLTITVHMKLTKCTQSLMYRHIKKQVFNFAVMRDVCVTLIPRPSVHSLGMRLMCTQLESAVTSEYELLVHYMYLYNVI